MVKSLKTLISCSMKAVPEEGSCSFWRTSLPEQQGPSFPLRGEDVLHNESLRICNHEKGKLKLEKHLSYLIHTSTRTYIYTHGCTYSI